MELRSPVGRVRAEAADIGEFLAIVVQATSRQVASITAHIGNFEKGLAQCTGFEGAVDVIIRQIAEIMGLPAFTVQDVRDAWVAIPEYFDRLDELAAALIRRSDFIYKGEKYEEDKGAASQVAGPAGTPTEP